MSVKVRVKITYEADVELPDDSLDDYGDLYMDAEDEAIYQALDQIRDGEDVSREEQVFVMTVDS